MEKEQGDKIGTATQECSSGTLEPGLGALLVVPCRCEQMKGKSQLQPE